MVQRQRWLPPGSPRPAELRYMLVLASDLRASLKHVCVCCFVQRCRCGVGRARVASGSQHEHVDVGHMGACHQQPEGLAEFAGVSGIGGKCKVQPRRWLPPGSPRPAGGAPGEFRVISSGLRASTKDAGACFRSASSGWASTGMGGERRSALAWAWADGRHMSACHQQLKWRADFAVVWSQ